jgi:hypothetical protein
VPLVDTTFTEYCGSYKHSWLDPRIYFLEVIIIHYNGFGTTALDRLEMNPNVDEKKLKLESGLHLTLHMSMWMILYVIASRQMMLIYQ